MAIVTGELYKGFTFGDVSSKDYGVYITQEAAYNAPDRDVEVVEIAGRNGAYILDKGRFKNITVSYKCGIALDDEQSFESAIRSFRNALSSKAGKYVRLEDEYNPNEYRQAAFLGGIEVDMADRRAGEFTVSFDAMPQRFLKSGETAVSVASGGTITNPTLFESHPLLQVWGYGEVGINDESVEVMHVPVGNVLLAQSATKSSTTPSINAQTTAINTDALNTGDDINVASVVSSVSFRPFHGISNTNIVYVLGGDGVEVQVDPVHIGRISIKYTPSAYQKGSGRTDTYRWRAEMTGEGSSTTYKVEVSVIVTYSTTGTVSVSAREINNFSDSDRYRGISITHGEITGYSTKSALGEPLYFDLDIGEAYKYEGDSIVSINNAVTIPAKLPTLKRGENTITYDDTITQFKVVPRWWEV